MSEHETESSEPGESLRHALSEIGLAERHFNGIQARYRLLASTWLLATFAAIGYSANAEKLPFDLQGPVVIFAVSVASSIGVQLLWIADLLVYQRLLDANFFEGLRLEKQNASIPKVRCNIREQFQKKGQLVSFLLKSYYWACAVVPLLLGTSGFLGWCILYHEWIWTIASVVALALTLTSIWLWRHTQNSWLHDKYRLLDEADKASSEPNANEAVLNRSGRAEVSGRMLADVEGADAEWDFASDAEQEGASLQEVESFRTGVYLLPGVYIEEVSDASRTITGVATSITAFVGLAAKGPKAGSDGSPARIRSWAEYERDFGGLEVNSLLGYAVQSYFLNGGREALIVRVTGGDGSSPTQTDVQEALKSLDNADLFNLLCVLPLDRHTAVAPQTWRAALRTCVEKRAMLLVDPDPEWGADSDDVVSRAITCVERLGLIGDEGRNAAMYFPSLIKRDPLRKDQLEVFPPCGVVAGIMARTDSSRGVWKAPAGVAATMKGVHSLPVDLSDTDTKSLNERGINCLRSLPTDGQLVWGARTMSRGVADHYTYVPVRRLSLFIEESIQRGLEWAVFEPNGKPLWERIRLTVGTFLQTLFMQGALEGARPEDAYFVKCDSETTTPTDISQGMLRLIVGFAPLKPGEFVVFQTQIRTSRG